MKVVYQKTIIEKLDEAILEAEKHKKKIDHFVLDEDEAIELYDSISDMLQKPFLSLDGRYFLEKQRQKIHQISKSKYCGIKIEVGWNGYV